MRVDLYTNPHKEQREGLYQVAIQAGKIDYSDNVLVEKLITHFDHIVAELHQHVRAEDAFVRPLYLPKGPSLVEPLDAEHKSIELLLEISCRQMEAIKQENHIDKRGELGAQFYRGFNRFIYAYLDHIDKEERLLPFLWECYDDTVLMNTIMTYKASIGCDDALAQIVTIFPSFDKITQMRLFAGFKENATIERFAIFSNKLQNCMP